MRWAREESAHWSQHIQRDIVGVIYEAGHIETLEHTVIFDQKDRRRAERLVAVLWR